MKRLVKRLLASCIALTFAAGLVPATAFADDASTLVAQINSYTGGGTGSLTAVESSPGVVTVTGALTGVSAGLVINIDPGLGVVWGATLSGTISSGVLLEATGTGSLSVTGAVSVDGDNSIAIRATAVTVLGSGSVSAAGMYAQAINGDSGTVTVLGGTVTVDGFASSAIRAFSGDVSVSGGSVSATGNTNAAIRHSSGTVSVSGGSVTTVGAMGGTHSRAIETSNGAVYVSGGVVSGEGVAVSVIDVTSSSVSVSGGTVSAVCTSTYICYSIFSGGSVTVSDGSIIAEGSRVIAIGYTKNVTMSGGVIKASGQDTYAFRLATSTGSASVTGGLVYVHGGAELSEPPDPGITIDSPAATVISDAHSIATPNQVKVAVVEAGTATGSSVVATYNGYDLSLGWFVHGGGTLGLAVTGAGSTSYTYLWSGTGMSGQTTPTVTLASLAAGIDATVTVTGVVPSVPPTPVFVPVTNIAGVPASITAGDPLSLSGSVAPIDSTNKTVVWSMLDAGTTGATLNGNTLTATTAGTVTVRATIVNGLTSSSDYTQDFAITVELVVSGDQDQETDSAGSSSVMLPNTGSDLTSGDSLPSGLSILFVVVVASGLLGLAARRRSLA